MSTATNELNLAQSRALLATKGMAMSKPAPAKPYPPTLDPEYDTKLVPKIAQPKRARPRKTSTAHKLAEARTEATREWLENMVGVAGGGCFTEHKFAEDCTPPRKFRFDFAWPWHKVALEVNGGVWTRGAHGRGVGIMRDYTKLNLAQSLGWRVIQVTPKDLRAPETLRLISACITRQSMLP